MKGTLYGVGVGPGDPELMTVKAIRMIRENDIIAVPGAEVKETVAYKIAVQAVPELACILRSLICSIAWRQTVTTLSWSAESLPSVLRLPG